MNLNIGARPILRRELGRSNKMEATNAKYSGDKVPQVATNKAYRTEQE